MRRASERDAVALRISGICTTASIQHMIRMRLIAVMQPMLFSPSTMMRHPSSVCLSGGLGLDAPHNATAYSRMQVSSSHDRNGLSDSIAGRVHKIMARTGGWAAYSAAFIVWTSDGVR